MAGGFALRLAGLDAQNLWGDEIYATIYARMGSLEELATFNVLARDPNPPLGYAVIWGWVRLAGETDFAFRFTSVMAGTATIAAAWAVARRVARPGVALGAAFVTAINPWLIAYSQEARAYALATLLVSLGVWCFLRILAPRPPSWLFAAFWALSVAAIASHYYAALVLAAGNLVFLGLVLARRPLPWRRWYLAQAAFLLPVLPFAPRLLEYAFAYRGENQFVFGWDTIASWLRWYLAGRYLAEPWGGLVAAGGLALAAGGAAWLWISRQRRALALAAAWSLLPIAVLAAVMLVTQRNLVEARYFLLLIPALLLMVGAGLAGLWRLAAPAALVAGALVVAAAIAGLLPAFTDPAFARPDYRGIVATLQRDGRPGDVVLASGDLVIQALQHYDRDETVPRRNLNLRRVERDPTLVGLANDYRRGWFIPYGATDNDDQVADWLYRHGWFISGEWFGTTRMRRFDLAAAGPPPRPFEDRRLAGSLQLTAAGLSPAAIDGGAVLVALDWLLPAGRIVEEYGLRLRAFDAAGHLVAETSPALSEGTLPAPTAPGAHRSRYALPIEPGTLPGPLRLEIEFIDRGQPLLWNDRAGRLAGTSAGLGTVELARDPAPLGLPQQLSLGRGAGIIEAGRLPASLGSGRRLSLPLTWQPPLDGPLDLVAELRAADGRLVASAPSLASGSPQPLSRNRLLRDWLDVPTSAVDAGGEYRLGVRLGAGPLLSLGSIRIDGRPRQFAQPPASTAASHRIGDVAEIAGWSAAASATPGSRYPVELIWRALRDGTPPEYTVFVQLLDAAGVPRAQSDAQPAGGSAPTGSWAAGEYIADRHELALAAGLAPGDYRLIAGLYDPLSGTRLPAGTGDFAVLGSIRIQ